MSNRPTPETDAAWACFIGYTEPLQDVKDLSCKLERERDEAREALIPFISLNPNSQRVKEKWDGFVQAAKKALEAAK